MLQGSDLANQRPRNQLNQRLLLIIPTLFYCGNSGFCVDLAL